MVDHKQQQQHGQRAPEVGLSLASSSAWAQSEEQRETHEQRAGNPKEGGTTLYKLPLLEGMPVSDLEATESR